MGINDSPLHNLAEFFEIDDHEVGGHVGVKVGNINQAACSDLELVGVTVDFGTVTIIAREASGKSKMLSGLSRELRKSETTPPEFGMLRTIF